MAADRAHHTPGGRRVVDHCAGARPASGPFNGSGTTGLRVGAMWALALDNAPAAVMRRDQVSEQVNDPRRRWNASGRQIPPAGLRVFAQRLLEVEVSDVLCIEDEWVAE